MTLDRLDRLPHLGRRRVDRDPDLHSFTRRAASRPRSRARPDSPAHPFPSRSRRSRRAAARCRSSSGTDADRRGAVFTTTLYANSPSVLWRRASASVSPSVSARTSSSVLRSKRPRPMGSAMRTMNGAVDAQGAPRDRGVVAHDAPGRARGLDRVADEVTSGVGESRQQVVDVRRDERERDELRVRMLDRSARRPAVIDERLGVHEPRVEVMRGAIASDETRRWPRRRTARRAGGRGPATTRSPRARRVCRAPGRPPGTGSGRRAPASRECRARRGRRGRPRAA